MTEMFGNGRSSSPSNTPEPFHGPRFPAITIRDDVEASRQVLENDLGIHHLRAVIGFSMGAQQAFQSAVSHPRFANRIVATSGTAKTWPHGYVRLEGQIRAITADAAFKDRDYTEEPTAGIEATGAVSLAGCSPRNGGIEACGDPKPIRTSHPSRNTSMRRSRASSPGATRTT